jgi:hypothetical protein
VAISLALHPFWPPACSLVTMLSLQDLLVCVNEMKYVKIRFQSGSYMWMTRSFSRAGFPGCFFNKENVDNLPSL